MKLQKVSMKKAKVFSLLTVIAVVLSVWVSAVNAQSKIKNPSKSVYIQTNGIANEIIHHSLQENGELVKLTRASTGGKYSGIFKPITGHESAPMLSSLKLLVKQKKAKVI